MRLKKKDLRTRLPLPIPADSKFYKMQSGFSFLVDGIKTCDKTSPKYLQYKKDAAYLYKRIQRAQKFVESIAEMKMETRRANQRSLIKMLGYLGLVESMGAAMVDFAIVILLVNDYCFHIESMIGVPRIRHAISIEDFAEEQVSLGTRLAFLRQNKLDFLAKMIDKKLRNCVAHLDFKIEEDGRIYWKKRNRYAELDIDQKIAEFRETIASFELFLTESGMLSFMEKQAETEANTSAH